MNYKSQLLSKISSNQEVIGIIGLGYVGLPLAVNFAEAGIKVIGFDKMQQKVDKINHGDNYIKDYVFKTFKFDTWIPWLRRRSCKVNYFQRKNNEAKFK